MRLHNISVFVVQQNKYNNNNNNDGDDDDNHYRNVKCVTVCVK